MILFPAAGAAIIGAYCLVIFFVLAIGIFLTVCWIWTLIDCLKNEPSEGNDKLVWLLVIIFLHGFGSLLYYFVRRPERLRKFGR